MKIRLSSLGCRLGIALCALAFPSPAQNPVIADIQGLPVVKERGPHHKVWTRNVTWTAPNGKEMKRQSSYTELASGMHYLDETGKWVESKPVIEIVEGGAVARQTAHQVAFAANLNVAGALDVKTPDGKRLRTHVMGLVYSDAVSGKSVLFAPTKNCIGDLHPPNQVIYKDAFETVLASVCYTLTRAGLEQDILFLENPPSPADYGIDPASCRLEVWTEFLDAPKPKLSVKVLAAEEDPLLRDVMAEPDFLDTRVDFGVMKMGNGRAFSLEEKQPNNKPRRDIVVGKIWGHADRRTFLIEKVRYPEAKTALDKLPKTSAIPTQKKDALMSFRQEKGKVIGLAAKSPPERKPFSPSSPIFQIAKNSNPTKGFVLDYGLYGSLNDFRFEGGTTYFVSGMLWLSGTNTAIEGGAVVKMTNSMDDSFIVIYDGLTCNTDRNLFAVFTSMNDNTSGEAIPYSSGNPQPSSYLGVEVDADGVFLKNLRFCYGYLPLGFDWMTTARAQNLQFVNCESALTIWPAMRLEADNCLFYHCSFAVYGNRAFTFIGRHLTANEVDYMSYCDDFGGSASLTNCLLVAITNLNWEVTMTTNQVIRLDQDNGIFQRVGAGYHYLATNSPYRDCGSTNIPADLLAELGKTTTYPPVVLNTNVISVNTTLCRQAGRDTDAPDLGYHYPPLDFAITMNQLSNAVLTLTNGVSVAAFGYVGLYIVDYGRLVSVGSPLERNHYGKYNTVQEQPIYWGYSSPGTLNLFPYHYMASNSPSMYLRFTDLSLLSGPVSQMYQQGPSSTLLSADIRDCAFYGGTLVFDSGVEASVSAVNNLFDGVSTTFEGYAGYSLYNNLFRGKNVNFDPYDGVERYIIKDNMFYGSALDDWGGLTNIGHNAYVNTTTYLGGGTNSTDKVLTNLVFQKVLPLGRFYQPTNSPCLDAGSRYATNAGLFHYTTTTNQVKEAGTMVDIGLHYVALDSNGQPYDTDGDGLPDYLEDANGNGAYDAGSGESNWQSYNSQNGLSVPSGLEVFTPLK